MKKIIYLIIIFIIVGFLFFLFIKYLWPNSTTREPHAIINDYIIKVEIADDFEEQQQGLSDRDFLCPGCGMLFVFPKKQVRQFWMKNMHFTLDIIWIDGDKVVGISPNLIPEGEQPSQQYSSLTPVNYVLEVNGGVANGLGIKAGDRIEIKK